MGLFSINYSKPGPGVNVDEPEKKGFFRFWEIIFEKFSKLMGANALYVLCSIPLLLILYVLAPVNTDWVKNLAVSVTAETGGDSQAFLETLMMGFRSIFAILIFTLWGSGPASAMYAYITKCFTVRNPVWIISDGFEKFKENFKQSIIVAIIDLAVLILGMNAIIFYYSFYASSGSMLWMFMCSLMVMVFIVYTWMHYYIYQMMTTFECKIGQLYKNSLLFAIGMLPINLFLTVISVIVIILPFMALNPMIAVLLDLFLLTLITRFPIEFTATRKIRKTLIDAKEKPAAKSAAKIEYLPDEEENR